MVELREKKTRFTPFRKDPSCVPMNANVMKTNTGKLLVAVLAIFVVVAGCAVILSDNGINAATTPDGTPEYPGNNGDFSTGTNYKLTTPITIGNGETVDLNGSTLYTEGNLITINGGTLKNGTVVDNNTKFGAICINNGTISGITLSDSRNGIYWSDDSVTPGDVTIENCTFTGTGLVSAIYYCVFPNNTNTVNISGCTFNGEYREGAINIEMSRQGITDSTKVVVSGTNPVSVNVFFTRFSEYVPAQTTLCSADLPVPRRRPSAPSVSRSAGDNAFRISRTGYTWTPDSDFFGMPWSSDIPFFPPWASRYTFHYNSGRFPEYRSPADTACNSRTRYSPL